MKKHGKKMGIIGQVAVFFLLAALVTGGLAFLSQRSLARRNVRSQTESDAVCVADEVRMAVTEYPAYEWLIRYWRAHADELEIEYDVAFGGGTETEDKCRLLTEHQPDLELRYAGASELSALPEDDQKLYAEITYSWLITRINEIKRSNRVDYLFCVITEDPFDKQFFLFSASDPDSVRGTNYEEVYPLGVQTTVGESQQQAMRTARRNSGYLADAGNYVDYYALLGTVDGQTVLVGLTFDLTVLQANAMKQTVKGTGRALIYLVALASLCLFMISHFVLRPLKKIQENIRFYRATKNSKAVIWNLSSVHPNNEMGSLSEDVADLALEIDDYLDRIKTITAEKERIGAELSLASRIQQAMLPGVFPAFPERSDFDIFAAMDPAREVGGDFYDFFLIDEDHLCMIIADVSGKGVPAALFMMSSKTVLENNVLMGKSPAQILMDVNNTVCANNQEEMFVTIWLGILELSSGKLVAANAGHEYPVIRRGEGQFELIRDRHGFVIGGMEGMTYKEYEILMEPGASLFLYTDGVVEAEDADRQMFGTNRMLEALNRQPDASPEEVLKNVKEAVEAFVRDEEQFDDLTMMCLLYKGPTA